MAGLVASRYARPPQHAQPPQMRAVAAIRKIAAFSGKSCIMPVEGPEALGPAARGPGEPSVRLVSAPATRNRCAAAAAALGLKRRVRLATGRRYWRRW
jgi:precorrin-6x reductase